MPLRPSLGKGHVAQISSAIDTLFDKLLARVLGGDYAPKEIRFKVRHTPTLSIPGLFVASNRSEGNKPDERLLTPVLEIAKGYLDVQRAKAKAKTINAVQSFLNEAHDSGETPDFDDVLQGKLYEVLGESRHEVKRIINTESTNALNTGRLDSVIKMNSLANVDDPTVFFICVHDTALCLEENERVVLPGTKEDVRVGDLKVGDRLVYPMTPSQRASRKVTGIRKKIAETIRLTFDNGRTLVCTPDHPILVRAGKTFSFMEAQRISDSHDVAFLDEMGKGEKMRATNSLKLRPYMAGYVDSWDFWKNNIDHILNILRTSGRTKGFLEEYGIPPREWDLYCRHIVALYDPLFKPKSGTPDNRWNGEYQNGAAGAVAVRYEALGGDRWLRESVVAGGSGLSIVRDTKLSRSFIREKMRDLNLISIVRARGGAANWAHNRDLLIRKAVERGIPHFRGVSRPEARAINAVRAVGLEVLDNHPIGNMRVDMFLPSCGVIVEYDGSGHDMRDRMGGRETTQRDFARDKRLQGLGYRIFRIKDPLDLTPLDLADRVVEFVHSERSFGEWRASSKKKSSVSVL